MINHKNQHQFNLSPPIINSKKLSWYTRNWIRYIYCLVMANYVHFFFLNNIYVAHTFTYKMQLMALVSSISQSLIIFFISNFHKWKLNTFFNQIFFDEVKFKKDLEKGSINITKHTVKSSIQVKYCLTCVL